MNLLENEQMYKKLDLLKKKINMTTTITDEEKEIYILISELLENSIEIIDDIRETMEI